MSRLENLPVEIVNCIFSNLCHHCNTTCIPTSRLRRDTRALIELTRTSKSCRSMALPFLFHSLYHYKQVKYIFWHQHFAKSTRALLLPFSSGLYDIPVAGSMAEMLSVADLRPVHFAVQNYGRSAEASLALTLCSRVERLQINLDTLDRIRASFKATFHLFEQISEYRGTPALLQSLKHLEVRSDYGPTDGIVASRVPLLLELTPRLEVLILRRIDGYNRKSVERYLLSERMRPALESLVEIQMLGWDLMRANTDDDTLEQFLTATKRFRTFKYISGVKKPGRRRDWETGMFRYVYPPWHWMNILLPAKSSLQHLTLDFGERGHNGTAVDVDNILVDPRQLREFTQLETLEIDQFCYCPHQDNSNHGKESITSLANMLPITIRKFSISFSRYSGGHQCLDCIIHLGQRVVAGDFPLLEQIDVNARSVTPPTDLISFLVPKELVDDVGRDRTNRRFEIEDAFRGSSVIVKYRFWVEDNGYRYL